MEPANSCLRFVYSDWRRDLTIRELIEEQRIRLQSSNPAERLAAALLIPAELKRRMRLLRNSEIGQLLEDEVWSNLSLLSPDATVCMEAADRLRRPTSSQENE